MNRFSVEINKIKWRIHKCLKVTYKIGIYRQMIYINEIDRLGTFFDKFLWSIKF